MRFFLTALLLTSFACSRPVPVIDKRYSVNALLNDSTWFGTAFSPKIYKTEDNRCKGQLFMLIAKTDIPYKGSKGSTRQVPASTGCLTDDCYTTQALNFENIPLKRGRYKLAKLVQCDTINYPRYHYWQTFPGGGTERAFVYKKGKPNWLRVTEIDTVNKLIIGKFAATLTDTSNRIIRFRQGSFSVKFKPL
jgi:hypothetical protein